MMKINHQFFCLITANLILSVISFPANLSQDEINPKSVKKEEYKAKLTEKVLLQILESFYDKYVEPNIKTNQFVSQSKSDYSKIFDEMEENAADNEKMMSDFPSADTVLNTKSENLKNLLDSINKNNSAQKNDSNSLNIRKNLTAERQRIKNIWLLHLQKDILEKTGRTNGTSVPSSITEPVVWILNRTEPILGDNTNTDNDLDNDDFVNKKIRSFYPSCEMPRNTDEEIWKDANTLNLFFNVDYNSGVSGGANPEQSDHEDTVNIASATLRLYRLPQDNNGSIIDSYQKNSNSHNLSDEDKQLRVSVYWYSRSLKKHKAVKRRLTDSRMIPLYINKNITKTTTPQRHFVEFNVRPAAKTWVRGRNLGLGIIVEDMDGNQINPTMIFKTPHCDTVGNVSTPIPIPTAFLDAHRSTLNSSDANFYTAFDTLLPNLDICTIELTHNHSNYNRSGDDTSRIVCKILKPIPELPSSSSASPTEEPPRHIRHRHSILANVDKMITKRLVIKNFNAQTQPQTHNISVVNR